jgi:hypothetical protein
MVFPSIPPFRQLHSVLISGRTFDVKMGSAGVRAKKGEKGRTRLQPYCSGGRRTHWVLCGPHQCENRREWKEAIPKYHDYKYQQQLTRLTIDRPWIFIVATVDTVGGERLKGQRGVVAIEDSLRTVLTASVIRYALSVMDLPLPVFSFCILGTTG